MFERVESYSGDPILSLMEDFKADPRPYKVNLSIGLYHDEQGVVPVLKCITEAHLRLASRINKASLYLPMEGMSEYCNLVQKLLLGETSPLIHERCVATIQTVGGSGALKIGADFLYRYFPRSTVWVSDPTWDNHISIFSKAGFDVGTYPYFCAQHRGVNFEAMLASLSCLAANDIVLLHSCSHNPTGADLTPEQWDQVVSVAAKKKLIPFLDVAYQGFSVSMERDAYAIRAFAAARVPALISNSFSKNFSLYGERVGALSVLCQSEQEATRVRGQLKNTTRCNYSSPPRLGAELVTEVLCDPRLKTQWLVEVDVMRIRIQTMRAELYNELEQRLPKHDFSYLIHQNGMFSYTGMSAQQVTQLKEESGVYLVSSGRLCVAGLTTLNIPRVAEAIAKVY